LDFRITIIRNRKPPEKNIQKDLDWFCKSFGFCEDTQAHTASKVLKEIIRQNAKGNAMGSTELASKVDMSRGAVIHQLNRLVSAGLIEKSGRYYTLRGASISDTIRELERDMQRIFEDFEEMAREMDEELGFMRR